MNYGGTTYGKRLILFLGIMTLFLLGREGNGATEKKASKIERVSFGAGQIYNTNTLPYELGVKYGIYKKEGIELDFLLIRGFAAMAAINSGDLNYAMFGGTAIRSIAAGMPVKSIMVNRIRTGTYMVARPGIHSVKELKGKVIGIPTVGDALDYAARAILSYHGLNPDKEVIIRPVGPGAVTYLALKTGTIDAGIMNVLHLLKLEQEKRGFQELMSTDDVTKGVSQNIIVSVKRLKEKPEEIKKVIRGTLKAIAFVRENRKEAIDFMVKEWGLERELAIPLYEREREGYNTNGKVPDDAFQEEIKLAQERGLLSPALKVPTSQLKDFTLLEEVLKEMGIR